MRHAYFLVPLFAALAACGATSGETDTALPAPANFVTLSGTALYRERIALPANARLAVKINDVSLMDKAAPVIAETEAATGGRQVPLAFSLDYDPARIDPRGRYSVSARITDGTGRLLWITDTHVALPRPGKAVELLMVRVTG